MCCITLDASGYHAPSIVPAAHFPAHAHRYRNSEKLMMRPRWPKLSRSAEQAASRHRLLRQVAITLSPRPGCNHSDPLLPFIAPELGMR